MTFPDFIASGDLPPGVHVETLNAALARFAVGSARRIVLGQRLERVYHIAASTGKLARFIVFGSFVTEKEDPNDVDVFMIMDDNFDVGTLTGMASLLFDHSAAQSHFGCSVFWIRRLAAIGGEQAAIEDWQIKRDGTRRGILEVIGE